MSGFVYFIGPDDWRLGRVKIGFTSSHPRARLSSFQTGSPFPLVIYGFTPGCYGLEHALHDTFGSLRFHGEWFDMRGKLLSLVSCLYFGKYGNRAHSESDFSTLVSECVCADDPPHPTFCSVDEWLDSADAGPIDQWMHDRAWEAYQREQGLPA